MLIPPATSPLCLGLEAVLPRSPTSQRVEIKHGPFTVPSMASSGGMAAFEDRSMTMPCSDCLITYIHAGLEYPNASYANVDTGMWLHHAVIYNANRRDTSCPQAPERVFASGNERTPADLTANGFVLLTVPRVQ
jgi:hypothetical protein